MHCSWEGCQDEPERGRRFCTIHLGMVGRSRPAIEEGEMSETDSPSEWTGHRTHDGAPSIPDRDQADEE